jgi:hypothetical protein
MVGAITGGTCNYATTACNDQTGVSTASTPAIALKTYTNTAGMCYNYVNDFWLHPLMPPEAYFEAAISQHLGGMPVYTDSKCSTAARNLMCSAFYMRAATKVVNGYPFYLPRAPAYSLCLNFNNYCKALSDFSISKGAPPPGLMQNCTGLFESIPSNGIMGNFVCCLIFFI